MRGRKSQKVKKDMDVPIKQRVFEGRLGGRGEITEERKNPQGKILDKPVGSGLQ